MLRIEGPNANRILRLSGQGEMSAEDIDNLTMVLENAIMRRESILLLEHVESESLASQALWEDPRLMPRFSRLIDRAAVVRNSRIKIVEGASLAGIAPFQTQQFFCESDAVRWLRQDQNDQPIDMQYGYWNDVVHVAITLSDKLSPTDHHRVAATLCDDGQCMKELRIVEHPKNDDGWNDPHAILSHYHLMQDHSQQLKRVALVGVTRWQHMVFSAGAKMWDTELRLFGPHDEARARSWAFDDCG